MALIIDKQTADFSEIYSDYFPIVYSAVYMKVSNAQDAEDITHEVFMRFYEKISEVDNIRKWLYGTMRNVVYEFYRKKDDNFNIDDVFHDMSLTFVNGFRDLRIVINEAIEQDANFKDETDRIIFDLVGMQGFTFDQAGKQLGLTRNQVKYRYHQIVKNIIHFLQKKGIQSLEDLL